VTRGTCHWRNSHFELTQTSRTKATALIPWELFDLDFVKPPRADRLLLSSSNGLASGNSIDEAVLHGLCEVIERDQCTLWLLKRHRQEPVAPTKIRLSSVDAPLCRALVDQIVAAGLDLHVWCCTGDIRLPTFKCAVSDPRANTCYPQQAGGSGCHPNKAIALSRALTEALQSRLTHISGSRDDCDWQLYRTQVSAFSRQACEAYLRYDLEPEIDYASVPCLGTRLSIEEMIDLVRRELESRGLNRILVVDLTRNELGVPVVYVCVPGLESSPQKNSFMPGERACRLFG
jgi:YcaO-like protein with predicted kinase domain